MKKIICLLTGFLLYVITWACYNETHVDKKGKRTDRSEPMDSYYSEPDKKEAKEYLNKYDLKKIQEYPADEQSNISVKLSYLGRYDEALNILRRIQITNPKDYNIAANLGTTYELLGKNDSALLFIKKGIQLNPDSHDGTEWVHIKILEAKLKIAKDPKWLATHSVLGTGASFSSKESEQLYKKAYDIEYQLKERIPFTPFPDAILGNVFNELGDLYATQQSVELAHIAYQFSLVYDITDNYAVKKKMDELATILRKNKIPLPSWRVHYLNREREAIKAEVVEEIIDRLSDKEKMKETKEAVTSLFESLTGETAAERREREQRRTMYITGSIIAGLLLIGFVVYRVRKRK